MMRWLPFSVMLLALTITGCSGNNPPKAAPVAALAANTDPKVGNVPPKAPPIKPDRTVPATDTSKESTADKKAGDAKYLEKKGVPQLVGALTVETLSAEFAKDRKATEAKYKSKMIEFEGFVDEIRAENAVHLKGSAPDTRFGVMCKVNCEDFGKFHWTSRGQKVKIKGRMSDVFPNLVVFEECSFDLMDLGKAQIVTAPTLAKEFEADAVGAVKRYEAYDDFVFTGQVEKVQKNENGLDVAVLLRTDGKLKFKFLVSLGSEPETIKEGQDLTVRACSPVRLVKNTIESNGFLAEKKYDAAAEAPKVKTTAKDLASEFVKDGAGAAAKYRRRVIEFDGVIGGITDGTVHLQGVKDGMNQDFTLLCNVNQEDHPKLYWAVLGERVKLRGVFANRFDGFVSFQRCSFEPFEKSKILIMTPAALAKDFEDGAEAGLKKYDSLKGFILSGVIDRITKRTDSNESENTIFLKTDRKTSVYFVVFNDDIHRSLTKGQTITVRPDLISYKNSSVRLTGVFVEAKK